MYAKKSCVNCGAIHKNPKFCSRNCAAVTNNSKYPKRKAKPKTVCPRCNRVMYSKKMRFCQECNSLDKTNPTIEELLIDNNFQKNARIREHARRKYLNRHDIKCIVCGYSKHVEICHIKPIVKFNLTDRLNDVNDYHNLAGLCPNCHWELDRGLVDKDIVKQKIDQMLQYDKRESNPIGPPSN